MDQPENLRRILSAIFACCAILSCQTAAGTSLDLNVELLQPGMNELNAYFFYPDKTFYYINQNGSNSGFRYIGSSGAWRVEKGELLIRIIHQYFFRDLPARVDSPARAYDYGAGNPLHFVNVKEPWEDLGSLVEYELSSDAYARDPKSPKPTAALREIIGGRVGTSEIRICAACWTIRI
jgi:hypothetical protein